MRRRALLLAALLVGCTPVAVEPEPAQAHPVSRLLIPPAPGEPWLEANPSGRAPLAAILRFRPTEAVELRITATCADHAFTIPASGEREDWDLPLVGFRPDRDYTVEVAVGGGRSFALPFRTPPLPEPFPHIELRGSHRERLEPGVVLTNIYRADTKTDGLLVAFDAEGEVVWFYRSEGHRVGGTRRLANGNFLYVANRLELVEIDLLGLERRRYHSRLKKRPAKGSIAVDVDSFHHELLELPSGNFLVLSSELRMLPDYPTSELDPDAPRLLLPVIGDVLVEFSPDGTVLASHALMDLLDPYRIGYYSLSNYWNPIYGRRTMDWSHANGMAWDPERDEVVISLRHQAALVAIGRKDGELRWILGDPEGWSPALAEHLLTAEGALLWPYHQHAPCWTSRGTLLLYDNGNANPFLDDALERSRAVLYSLDAESGTARVTWSDELGPRLSVIAGDADRLPGGNLMILDSFIVEGLEDGLPQVRSWLRELDPARPDTALWSARLPLNMFLYRALPWARLPGERGDAPSR